MSNVICSHCGVVCNSSSSYVETYDVEVGSTGGGINLHGGKLDHFGFGATYEGRKANYRTEYIYTCQSCMDKIETEALPARMVAILFILLCLWFVSDFFLK